MHLSNRLNSLPPYVAAEIAARASVLSLEGVDIINLSVGSPDLPPDPRIVAAAEEALEKGSHGYIFGHGHPAYLEAVASYMQRRFGLEIDPGTQVLALLGSKEGLAHLPIAICNQGDAGLYPDPGYLVYRPSLLLAGAQPVPVPLEAGAGWKPDWVEIETSLADIDCCGPIRMLVLNYPHNPTASVASLHDFSEAIRWTRNRGAIIVNDNAYADIGFDGYQSESILQAPEAAGGTAGCGVVEFHSMSKTFSMAGWRCAFAVGDPEIITALARVKTYYDTGSLEAIQRGAATALDLAEEIATAVSRRYQERRDMLRAALEPLDLTSELPRATIYLWAKLPEGEVDDVEYCRRLLEEAGVALSPGSAFGERGRGHIRFSLTAPEERLEEVVERLRSFGGSS